MQQIEKGYEEAMKDAFLNEEIALLKLLFY